MHPAVARAFEEIDAAIFSGDTFSTEREDFDELRYYLGRWSRELPVLERQLEEYEAELEEDLDDD